MQILSSTPIALVLVGVILALGPFRGLAVLFALIPMGMMAAVNLPAVGGTSILAVDLAVMALAFLIVLRADVAKILARLLAPRSPGFPLLLFAVYAAIATLFLPRVFAGETEVFGIGRIANAIGIVIRPLAPSNGNLSQILRLGLSTLAFMAVAYVALRRPDPAMILRCVKIVTVVHVGMGFVDILTNAAGAAFLLDWARTANYALTLGHEMAGLNRMIGGFPEASAYGYVSLGLFGFWVSYWFLSPEGDRSTLILTLLTAFVVLRGTSSSAYVAAMGLLAVFVALHAMRARDLMARRRTAAIMVGLVALIPLIVVGAYALYDLVPGVQSFVDRSLLNKLESDSGVERMSWNRQALVNLVETNFFGAGLGAVRASNWLVSTLATTGIIGALLMVAFLARLFALPLPALGTMERQLAAAAKCACAGFLMRALVVKATPNLEFGFFVFAAVATGLCLAGRPAPMPVSKPAPSPAAQTRIGLRR